MNSRGRWRTLRVRFALKYKLLVREKSYFLLLSQWAKFAAWRIWWNAPHIYEVSFTWPPRTEHIENSWREETPPGRTWMVIGQTFLLSCLKWANQMSLLLVKPVGNFLLTPGVTLDTRHHPAVSPVVPQCLTKHSPKPVRSREKPLAPSFALLFMWKSSDKTTTVAAFTLFLPLFTGFMFWSHLNLTLGRKLSGVAILWQAQRERQNYEVSY